MVTDRVGDFIIRLQNAGAVHKPVVLVPRSRHLEAIAKKLAALGFVSSVGTKESVPPMLEIKLAYDERGEHKIRGVKRTSAPGRRLYTAAVRAHAVKNGAGARIISTPKGILTDAEARKNHMGGEDLFEIW